MTSTPAPTKVFSTFITASLSFIASKAKSRSNITTPSGQSFPAKNICQSCTVRLLNPSHKTSNLCQLHTLMATSLNLKSHIAYVNLISSKKFSHSAETIIGTYYKSILMNIYKNPTLCYKDHELGHLTWMGTHFLNSLDATLFTYQLWFHMLQLKWPLWHDRVSFTPRWAYSFAYSFPAGWKISPIKSTPTDMHNTETFKITIWILNISNKNHDINMYPVIHTTCTCTTGLQPKLNKFTPVSHTLDFSILTGSSWPEWIIAADICSCTTNVWYP